MPQCGHNGPELPCSAGLCCGVDQAVNGMLPGPMRSDRPESLFKHLCVESTGTASFTFFAPIGTACNVTAFHQETKKRRSWNVGTGDFIVQPVSTADTVRYDVNDICCSRTALHHQAPVVISGR